MRSDSRFLGVFVRGILVVAVLTGCLIAVGCGNGNSGTGGSTPTTPSLAASVSSTGNFSPNQVGAAYTITVSNAAGHAATSGTVTVTDPPTNFTPTAIAGTGWTCVLTTLTCTRSDALAAGQSYPPITVTGNVTATAGQTVSVPVSVAGGGATSTSSMTGSITVAAAALAITKTHTGSFAQAQSGATYTIRVSNGTTAGMTGGKVTVTDTVPTGLTLVSMAGTGWTCPGTGGATTCDRNDALAGGASYPAITAIVNVGVSAATPQVNAASASGGGSATANASDSTVITVSGACTTNCGLSGTVTGPLVSGVTIALTGTASANTTTAANGTYTFTNLATGTYTVTPSLAGYTYTPVAPSVNVNSTTTTQNFIATSAVASFSISGAVTYAGTKTGTTFIRVYPSGCNSGCSPVAGITVPSPNGSYTVRGLAPTGIGGGVASYVVTAEIDTLSTGVPNGSNPSGSSTPVTIASSNVTGINVTVNNRTPSTLVTPTGLNIFPSGGAAFVIYNNPSDANGEIATSYKIYYGTDTAASNLTPVTIPSGDSNNVYVLSSLTNGTPYYFKMSALNANGESAPTSVVGPVTIGSSAGSNTVSGTVNFTGAIPAGAALDVGFFSSSAGVFFQRITNPTGSQAYSVAGIPSGTYQNFAILDIDGNGLIGLGDVTNFGQHGPPPLVVSGSTSTNNITLTATSASAFVTTTHQRFGVTDTFGLTLGAAMGTKRPVSLTLVSGKNVAVPFDMVFDKNNGYSPIYNTSVSPTVGDTYLFQVLFSDGTSANISGTVTAVLSSFAQNLVMSTIVPNSRTVPLLTWAAPVSPPAFYSYSVSLSSATGTSNWNYSGGQDGNGIPSTQTSVVFNVDGSASPNSPLVTGTTYNWSVSVQDANGNNAQISATPYIP